MNLYSTFLKSVVYFIAYLIAPPFCAGCKQFMRARKPLCFACTAQIKPIVSRVVPVTKKYEIKVLAVSDYVMPLRALVLSKGYGRISACVQLGEIMWTHSAISHIDFDVIVPIPLHWRRYAKRGFNQSHEIARVIAQKSGKPLVNALWRLRATEFQSQFSKDLRQENVKGVFELHAGAKKELKNKRVLIVDDLMTTGATLRSAARKIIDCRPEAVIAVVACRVV